MIASMPGTNLTREEAQTRAQLIDVGSYTIELDLTTSWARVCASSRVRLVPGMDWIMPPAVQRGRAGFGPGRSDRNRAREGLEEGSRNYIVVTACRTVVV